ncbi:alpha/beta fold hydrolase [Terrilactibacillus sp. S3-3]|nr:alpha/beta fold hydrolase [Terrilactibacillus sp. S3-3]
MPKLQIDDYELHYYYHFVRRDRPTLVFIHDLSWDSTTWCKLLPQLDPTFNLLTYDFFGHGDSSVSAALISVEKLFREVMELIHVLDLKNLHFVGSGMGGVISFFIARQHPELLHSLILMSMPFYVPRDAYEQEIAIVLQLFELDRELLAKKMVIENVYPITPEKEAILTKALKQVSFKNFKHIVIFFLLNINYPDSPSVISELKHIEVPTMILHGEFDPLFPADLSVVCATQIPNGRGFVIPQASHLIELDQPELVAGYINQFIRSDKLPVPVSAVHRQMINKLKYIIDAGYQDILANRSLKKMTVMKGELEIMWGGEPIEGKWNQRFAKEFFLFIILKRNAVKRDELIAAFMPELPVSQARNYLRVQLNHLNRIFGDHDDPMLQNVMMIGRDAVVLNADVQCDIVDYLDNLDRLLDGQASLTEQAQQFVQMLKSYNPSSLASFRGEWISTLFEKIESKLSEAMMKLLKS